MAFLDELADQNAVNLKAIEDAQMARRQRVVQTDPLVDQESTAIEAPAPKGDASLIPDTTANENLDATEAPEDLESAEVVEDENAEIDALLAEFGGGAAPQDDVDTLLNEFSSQLPENAEPTSAFPDAPPAVQILSNAAVGFNEGLADAIGVPLEGLDRVWRIIGASAGGDGEGFLDNPTDANKVVKDAFKRVGILPKDNLDNFQRRVGRSAFQALTFLAVLQANAPRLAAIAGKSTTAFIAQQMGKFHLQYPGLAFLGELGSVAGAQKGVEEFGPAGAVVGGLAGGAAVGIGGGHATGAILSPVKALDSLVRFFRVPKVARGQEPIKSGIPSEASTFYASEQVAGDVKMLENSIQSTINKIRQPQEVVGSGGNRARVPLTPEVAEIRLRRGLEATMAAARKIESKFWKRIPKNVDVSIGRVQAQAIKLQDDLDVTPNTLPRESIELIENLDNTVSTGKLLKLRSGILASQREARAAGQSELVANHGKLVASIDASIKAGLPDEAVVDQALNFSRAFNDAFTRGPVGEVLRFTKAGDPLVSPTQTASNLLKKFGGVGGDRAGGEFGLEQVATGARLAGKRKKVLQEAEGAVRARFRQIAEEDGPEAAEAFMRKHEPNIRALGGLSNEFKIAQRELAADLAQLDEIKASALAKHALLEPSVAAKRILSSGNPKAEVDKLLKSFEGNEDAIEGLQNTIMETLFHRARTNGPAVMVEDGQAFEGIVASRLQNMLNDPKVSSMLNKLFENTGDPDKLSRLNKIVNIAARLEAGEGKSGVVIRAGKIVGGVTGAFVGRAFSGIMGSAGTIQVPGIFAMEGRRIVTEALQRLNPTKILRYAMTHPEWEQVLLSKLPTNAKEARIFTRKMQRAFSVLEGTRKGIVYGDVPFVPSGPFETGPDDLADSPVS